MGSVNDPQEVPGLTKLVNSIVISCGSEKYPNHHDHANDNKCAFSEQFDDGFECATMSSSSRFYFSLRENPKDPPSGLSFELALDKFAHQFSSPFMSREHIEASKQKLIE